MIEVLTLHMRGMSGDKRAQALGEMVQAPLCDSCLDAYVAQQADASAAIRRQALLFGFLMLLGLLLALLPIDFLSQMRLFGYAFALVGAAGLVFGIRSTRERAQQIASASLEQNRARFLPELALKHLPGKAGQNDVSYIPWEDKLCDMTLGELMARYQLLPQIAQQLRDKARQAFRGEAPSTQT